MDGEADDLLSVSQAAVRLRRCYSATRDLALRGELRAVMVAGRVYVRRDSVDAWLADRQRDPAGTAA